MSEQYISPDSISEESDVPTWLSHYTDREESVLWVEDASPLYFLKYLLLMETFVAGPVVLVVVALDLLPMSDLPIVSAVFILFVACLSFTDHWNETYALTDEALYVNNGFPASVTEVPLKNITNLEYKTGIIRSNQITGIFADYTDEENPDSDPESVRLGGLHDNGAVYEYLYDLLDEKFETVTVGNPF